MSLLEEEHEVEEGKHYRVVNWPLAGLIGLWRFVVCGFWRCHFEFFDIEQGCVAAQMVSRAWGAAHGGAWGRVVSRALGRVVSRVDIE